VNIKTIKKIFGLLKQDERKPLVFSSLPKSGTDFVWHSLLANTGRVLPFWVKDSYKYERGKSLPDDIYSVGVFTNECILPKNFNRFSKKYPNTICGFHCFASDWNIRALRTAGIKKVLVLIRDPRDAMISWRYHLLKAGKEISKYISHFCSIDEGWFMAEKKVQYDYLLRTWFPDAVKYLESWLTAAGDDDIEILISPFELLRENNKLMIERAVYFFGNKISNIELQIPQKTQHFRTGKTGNWHQELTKEQNTLAVQLLGSRLEVLYDKAAEASFKKYSRMGADVDLFLRWPSYLPFLDQKIKAIQDSCKRDSLLAFKKKIQSDSDSSRIFDFPDGFVSLVSLLSP